MRVDAWSEVGGSISLALVASFPARWAGSGVAKAGRVHHSVNMSTCAWRVGKRA